MSPGLLRHLLPRLCHRRPLSSAVAAAVRQDAATWTAAPLSLVAPASADASLFHVAVDLSDSPDLAAGHTVPGQYLQLRLPGSVKPVFLSIASPPAFAASRGEFQFLVKRVPGSTAELLCGLRRGDVVELSGVMGRGFEVERISPPDAFPTVLIFATGSGIRKPDSAEENWDGMTIQDPQPYCRLVFHPIEEMRDEILRGKSPIRSLIESGFHANERTDVRLYYGARSLQRMAYQDRFKDWEPSGLKIIPVLSQPDDRWEGERGYVQTSFLRAKQIVDPSLTGAVLCGRRLMTEDVISELVACGVSKEKILKNF